ncbi:MAG: MFS family permease, partial [Gammaproteobacteria bacterium]
MISGFPYIYIDMHRLEHRQKIIIMVALMAGMLFSSLNQTIVGTALPRIISDLGGMEYFTWVFTIYMLASTVPVVIVGKLSDIYGRRPWILIGIGIFIVGSLLCGLAETIVQLIVFRGIQGLGGGIIMASSFAAVGDLFPPRERGKWQSMLTGMYGVASMFGPALGGYIVDYLKWQWVFWVFIPIGFVAFGLIWALFPKIEKKADQSIDYLGSAMLVATLIPLMLAFSWAGQKYDWLAVETLALFSAALVCLVIFIAAE